jgi:hypothetical protein
MGARRPFAFASWGFRALMLRPFVSGALVAIGVLSARAGSAQERWVDDQRVLAAGHVRFTAGAGLVRLANISRTGRERVLVGTGLDLAEAVGLGQGLEAGVRFGVRLDDVGRGTRADEAARGLDTETFGTGLSVAANPEIRLRWRAFRWATAEAGIEDRITLPIAPDPTVTELAGAWVSLHLGSVGRLDAGLEGVFGWQSFAREHVLEVGAGVPVTLSANLTPALFAALVSTTHYEAATPYTAAYARLTAGLGAGYRLGAYDIVGTTLLVDAMRDFTRRLGFGISVSYRL